MSSSSVNSMNGVLSNPGLLSALYPNLNLSSLAQLYTSEQAAMEAPLQQISTELQTLSAQATAWHAIQSGVSALQSDFQKLSQTSTWQSATAGSTNTSVVTATAGSSATPGTYIVNVTQVGQPEVATGSSTYTSDTTALNLNAETDTINGVSISIASTDSLQTIAQKINSANAGVTAAIVNANGSYQLSLSSTSDSVITGSGNDLFGTTAQGVAINLSSPVQAAKDWQYTVNGIAATSTSATDAQTVPGITMTLEGTGSATIAVSTSSSSAQSTLQQLASDYNSLQSTIAGYTGKGDTLAGDATAEGIMSQINRQLFSYNTNQPVGYQTVADAGLTLTLNSDKTTTLTFSSTTFSSAYSTNATAVQSIFTGTSGVATGLQNLLQSLSASGTGVIATILNANSQQVQALQQSEQAEQSLIQMQQTALGNQFTQEINALIAMMGQQSTVNSLVNAITGQSSSSSSSSKG